MTHWLSDGGGGVGVYPPHDYTQLFKIKKKNQKKKKKRKRKKEKKKLKI